MTFFTEKQAYTKAALSDLQGAWLNLRETIIAVDVNCVFEALREALASIAESRDDS